MSISRATALLADKGYDAGTPSVTISTAVNPADHPTSVKPEDSYPLRQDAIQ